jgi:hypothetical protein
MCAIQQPPPVFLLPWQAPLVWLVPSAFLMCELLVLFLTRRSGRFPRLAAPRWYLAGLLSYPLWMLVLAESLAVIYNANLWSEQQYAFLASFNCDTSLSAAVLDQKTAYLIAWALIDLAAVVFMMGIGIAFMVYSVARAIRREAAANITR